MACPSVTSSRSFLTETLAHLDCQAQVIGSFGFQSLAAPESPAAFALTALLTLFIALFGIRLLFGARVGLQDGVGATLKLAIVLTLALSWPAYRILVYDVVLKGPAEVAAAIGGPSLPGPRSGLAGQLQQIDDNILALTMMGTGRQTGSLERPGETADTFRGIALADESALGWGRTLFLGATIGSLATLRIAAGLLLALAPLFAGMLLFDVARGLFAGWLRGLVLTALGSIGITLLLSVQVALMEPWLADVLYRRRMGYATPAAPTELIALALGFGIAAFGLLALLARVAFQNGWPIQSWFSAVADSREEYPHRHTPFTSAQQAIPMTSRALAVSQGMLATMRREGELSGYPDRLRILAGDNGGIRQDRPQAQPPEAALGSSYRRNARRAQASQRLRDSRS